MHKKLFSKINELPKKTKVILSTALVVLVAAIFLSWFSTRGQLLENGFFNLSDAQATENAKLISDDVRDVYAYNTATDADGGSWRVADTAWQKDPSYNHLPDGKNVYEPYVMKDDTETDPNKIYKMWATRSINPSVQTRSGTSQDYISYFTSSDGKTWVLAKDQAVGPDLTYQSTYTDFYSPTVIKESPTSYKMWYGLGQYYNQGMRYATSTNGADWDWSVNSPDLRDQLTPPVPNNGYIYISWSSVIKDGSNYKMWYVAGRNTSIGTNGGKIFYATSTDGTTWTGITEITSITPLAGENTLRAPFVMKDGGDYKIWFTVETGTGGYDTIYATSTDGINWTRSSLMALTRNQSFETAAGYPVEGVSVIRDGGTYKMWYSSYGNIPNTAGYIGYATFNIGSSFPEKANIISSPQGVDIINAENNQNVASIHSATTLNALPIYRSSDVPYSLTARNGKVYIGTYSGLVILDFMANKIYKVHAGGTFEYNGSIAQANNGLSYNTTPISGGYKIFGTGAAIYDVSSVVKDGQTYIAALGDTGGDNNSFTGSIINILQEGNPSAKKFIIEKRDDLTGVRATKIHFAQDGTLYVAKNGRCITTSQGPSCGDVIPYLTADYVALDGSKYDANGNRYLTFGTGWVDGTTNRTINIPGEIYSYYTNLLMDPNYDVSDKINDIASTPGSGSNNHVYVATSKGAVRITENKGNEGNTSFRNWQAPNLRADESGVAIVNAIAANKAGNDDYVWLGQKHQGVAEINGTETVKYNYDIASDVGVSANQITSLSYGTSLAVGTDNGANRLSNYNPISDTESRVSTTYQQLLSNDVRNVYVYDTTQDSDGGAWRAASGKSWSTTTADTIWKKLGMNTINDGGITVSGVQVHSPFVMKDGAEYKMWATRAVGGYISYFTSPDGKSWTLANDHAVGFGVASTISYNPTVVKVGSTYKMWYGTTNTQNTDQYIRYATSTDGITWDWAYATHPDLRTQLTPVAPNNGYAYMSTSSVVYDGTTYKMWYAVNNNGNWGYGSKKIYYATSTDGTTWTGKTEITSLALQAGETGLFAPTVINDGGQYKMWFSVMATPNTIPSYNTVYATSPDGITWTRSPSMGLIRGNFTFEKAGSYPVERVSVIREGQLYKIWYSSSGGGNIDTQYRLGYATYDFIPRNFGAFPERAHIISTPQGIDIVDSQLNNVWMSIIASNQFNALSNYRTSEFPSSVVAKNGKIYITTTQYGLVVLDLTADRVYKVTNTGSYDYNGGITQVNSGSGYTATATPGGYQLGGDWNFGVDSLTSVTVGGKTYIATMAVNGSDAVHFTGSVITILEEGNPSAKKYITERNASWPTSLGINATQIHFGQDGTLYVAKSGRFLPGPTLAPLSPWLTADYKALTGTYDAGGNRSINYNGSITVNVPGELYSYYSGLLVSAAADKINDIFSTSNAVYVATSKGTAKITGTEGASTFETWAQSGATHNVLTENQCLSVAANDTNLWIGQQNTGLAEIALSTPDTVNYITTSSTPLSLSGSNTVKASSVGTDSAGNTVLVLATGYTSKIATSINIGDQDSDGISDASDLCPLSYQTNTCYIGRAQKNILATMGGQVQTPDNSVKVEIPANILDGNQNIRVIGGRSNFALGTTGQMVSDYEFYPTGAVFNSPGVTITMGYDDVNNDGKEDRTLISEASLYPLFGSSSSNWQPLKDCSDPANTDPNNCVTGRDSAANTISFRVSHFSEGGLAGPRIDAPVIYPTDGEISYQPEFSGTAAPGSLVSFYDLTSSGGGTGPAITPISGEAPLSLTYQGGGQGGNFTDDFNDGNYTDKWSGYTQYGQILENPSTGKLEMPLNNSFAVLTSKNAINIPSSFSQEIEVTVLESMINTQAVIDFGIKDVDTPNSLLIRWTGMGNLKLFNPPNPDKQTPYPMTAGTHKLKLEYAGQTVNVYIDDNLVAPLATSIDLSSFSQANPVLSVSGGATTTVYWDNYNSTLPLPGTPESYTLGKTGMELGGNSYMDPAPMFGDPNALGVIAWFNDPTILPAAIPSTQSDVYVYLSTLTIPAGAMGNPEEMILKWTVYGGIPQQFINVVVAINSMGLNFVVDAYAKAFTYSNGQYIPETLPLTNLGTISATGEIGSPGGGGTPNLIAKATADSNGFWTAYFGRDENGNVMPGFEAKDENGVVIPDNTISIFDMHGNPYTFFAEVNGVRSAYEIAEIIPPPEPPVVTDTTPPTTTISVAGTPENAPYEGWYKDTATVTLTATDSEGNGGGSGEIPGSGIYPPSNNSIAYTGPVNLVDGSTIANLQPTFNFTINNPSAASYGILLSKAPIDLNGDPSQSPNTAVFYVGDVGSSPANLSFTVGQSGGMYLNGSAGQSLVAGQNYYWMVVPLDAQMNPISEGFYMGSTGSSPSFIIAGEGGGSTESGVAKTEYSLSGATTLALTTYTAPFAITNLGETIVYFKSTDVAGNIEVEKTVTVRIDKDSDGDGLYDNFDECALISGKTEFYGCPAAIDAINSLYIQYTGDVPGYAAIVNGKEKKNNKIALAPGAVGDSRGEVVDSVQVKIYTVAALQASLGTSNFDNNLKNQCGTIFDTISPLKTTSLTSGEQLISMSSAGNYVLALRGQISDPSDGVTRSATVCRQIDSGKFNYDYNKDGTPDTVAKSKNKIMKVIKNKCNANDPKKICIQVDAAEDTEVEGSLLEITYPTEARWEEGVMNYVYPYFFESDSDWTVDVCSSAPTGYQIVGIYDENGILVSTNECTQAIVAGTMKVAAFEIAEVGSPPVFDVSTNFTVKHQGKTTKITKTINSKHVKAEQLQKSNKNSNSLGTVTGKSTKDKSIIRQVIDAIIGIF